MKPHSIGLSHRQEVKASGRRGFLSAQMEGQADGVGQT